VHQLSRAINFGKGGEVGWPASLSSSKSDKKSKTSLFFKLAHSASNQQPYATNIWAVKSML
jgi:hypothetical protein